MEWLQDERIKPVGKMKLVEADDPIYRIEIALEVISLDFPERSSKDLYGEISYRRFDSVIVESNLNYEYKSLPNGLKHYLKSGAREIMTDFVKSNNQNQK